MKSWVDRVVIALMRLSKIVLRFDLWVERLIVGLAIISMTILLAIIAWGIAEGKYSIVSPFDL